MEQKVHELDARLRQMKEERDQVIAENDELQVSIVHTQFLLKVYHFMFHFMSSFVTWDDVILVLIIFKTHVWLRDF